MNREITPHTCPVCNGQGKVATPPWVAGDQPTFTTTVTELYVCPACKGEGVLWK